METHTYRSKEEINRLLDIAEENKLKGINYQQSATQLGVEWRTLYTWRKRYVYGSKGNETNLRRERRSPQMERHTSEFWEKQLNEQATSGVTAAEFCRQRGIALSAFYTARYNRQGKRGKGKAPQVEPSREIIVEPNGNGNDKKKIQELQNEITNLKLLVADYALDVSELKKYIGRV